ncbi:MAG: DMT family transporter [Anaerolineae bacterium]
MTQFQKAWQMPYLLLIFPPLFWAGNAVLARGIVGIVPPISLSFFRWGLAFLIVLPFGLAHARQDWPLVKEKWWVVAGLGFLGITCFSALLYVAAQTTTSVNLAVLQTILPAIVILLNLALLGERITGRQGVGVGISIVGAVVIIVAGDPRKLIENGLVIGDGIMMLAVTIYALYSVVLRYRPNIHPLSLLVYTFGFGVLMLLPVYLWELSRVGGFVVTPGVILSFLYLGTCPTILAYLCWNQGIKLAGPSSAGLFINLLPVFAAILAVLFLGESVRWYHFVGMVLVFSGMLLFNKR